MLLHIAFVIKIVAKIYKTYPLIRVYCIICHKTCRLTFEKIEILRMAPKQHNFFNKGCFKSNRRLVLDAMHLVKSGLPLNDNLKRVMTRR